MVAGGMPEQRAGNAFAVAEMALDILSVVERISAELEERIAVRVGMHTGPAVAGVIGTRKLSYDVWGDTVNTAARMESHGVPAKIQVTKETMRALEGRYEFERGGFVNVKGKGEMEIFYLLPRRT
jgi:adenylate cyclase